MCFQLEEGNLLFGPLYSLFVLCVVVHYLFTLPRWKHFVTSIRALFFDGTRAQVAGKPKPGLIKTGMEPQVTVVICAYNEGAVVPTTIDHACMIDWPADKLTIHVCDDSTDETSMRLIDESVAYWKGMGVDIERLTRPDRVGYKAGNLRHNFPCIKGDYVAYFDADHRPDHDFLQKTMPYFFDQNGQTKKKTALVQTPWAFYNTHENMLTECGKQSECDLAMNGIKAARSHSIFLFFIGDSFLS